MQTDNELLLLAINAAWKAGCAVQDIYNEGFEVEWKEDNSPVTKADLLADDIIRQELQPAGINILSEEAEKMPFSERKNWQQYWCVDPIDGTRDFINKTNNFCVCIALIRDQKAYMGIIYLPVTKTMYYGINNGSGAFKAKMDASVNSFTELNAQKMPSQQPSKALTLLATSYHMNSKTQNFIQAQQEQYPDMRLLRVGSAIKFCRLADGEAHLYPRFGKMNDWDIAAGHAILEAAGGSIEPMFEKEFLYNDEKLYRENFFAWMNGEEFKRDFIAS